MANTKKRVLSLLMAVMMMLSALPTNAFALEIPGLSDLGALEEVAELLGDGKLVCEDENHCEHGDDCYLIEMVPAEHDEKKCYHTHSEPVYLLGLLVSGCEYNCTEHTHSVGNGCPTGNCDAHGHSSNCCELYHEHGVECYTLKQVCSHGWMIWKCNDSCYKTELTCTTTEHDHSSDCVYTCGISTEHTHDADCYSCEINEHTHGKSCERKCGKNEGLICEETHEVEKKTLICTKNSHNEDCYYNLDDIKAEFSHIESTEELAESALEFGKCWLNGGKCGLTYMLGEVEMNLCEEHFCTVCTRLHKYCDCVEVTFANVGNVADATVVVKIKNGETVPTEKVPAAEVINFHFLGWFDAEENEFSTEAAYAEDITFTAKYQALAEYEKLQNTIEFIKNNFDLGTELGRLITILSNGEITKETVQENKDEAILAVEAYLFANQLTGKISREQAGEIVNLMKQGNEYVLMVAEWLWPENAVMMPTIEEILESVDFEKLSEEIKDLIAEKHGVEFDENWVENNKELADQYIKECLDEVKSITEEQRIIIRDQIENEKAHAAEVLDTVRAEMRDQIRAEIAHAKEIVNAVLADRELGLKIGNALTKLTGLNADSAAAKGEKMQGALVAAIRMSGLTEEQKNAVVTLIESGDNGMIRIIDWLWPTYTVNFVNGETIIESDVVAHGTMPSFDGETPVKEADAQYTYTFAGWDKDFTAVTGDVTYTAVFTSTVNEYTVIFADEDGTVLQRSAVAYGEMPAFTSETPVKAATAQHTYTFGGWDKEITAVTGDATYTATYTATVRSYTVTFVSDDEVLKTVTVQYGKSVGVADAPAATSLYKEGHYFMGWDADMSCITNDMTVNAIWEIMTFTVTWEDGYGNVLETDTQVPYGTMPEYNGETPVAHEDPRYIFTFACFNPTVSAVTENVTYRATYVGVDRMYTVIFRDEDGSVISETEYKYGDEIVVPELPTRKGFTSKWNCEIPAAVEGDLTVEVVWSYEFYNSHKLKVFVGYGESATDKTLNWFETTAGKIYNVRSYYSFYENGKYTGSKTLTEGVDYERYEAAPGNITVNGVTYTNGANSSDDYYVINEYVVVATKAEYHLDCHATLYHTVTFVDDKGTVIGTVTVQHGEAVAEVPVAPSKQGHYFTKWSEDLTNVTESKTVIAEYDFVRVESAKLKINVGNGNSASGSTKGNSFSHWGKIYNARSCNSYYETYTKDSVMADSDFDYERTISDSVNVPSNVKRNGVTYTNGKGSSDNYYVLLDNGTFVSCKAEYHLDYKAEFYNVVTFVVDGVEYKVDVLNGSAAEVPADISYEKEGCEFTGWDADFSKVTKSMTVNAKWEIKTYTVTYLSDGEVVGTETVEYGKRATGSVSATLTKEGHTFAGWDADISCVTGNMTVNAEWERNIYNVTFYLPTGGSKKIQVKHGDKLEAFVPKMPAGEEFRYWYNSKGGAKLDFDTFVVTQNVSFSCKTRWIVEDHDVALYGRVDGNEIHLGTAIFEDSYHARKYSNKELKANQYDPAKIILPEDMNVITVNGVEYFYGNGDNYYTVEFTTLRSYMKNGYSYRYYGDVTLYHRLVSAYLVVDGSIIGRTTLRNIENGTVLTHELLGLEQGQFVMNETVVTESGNIHVAIGEHKDRFACRDNGTLEQIACDNGVYTYTCSRCHQTFRTEDDLQGGTTGAAFEQADRKVIFKGIFGTARPIDLGTGYIKNYRAADSFDSIGAVNAFYDWNEVVMPEFGAITVNGVTYTYGEGSSDNYYTVNFFRDLCVEEIDGEYVYVTNVELTLFVSTSGISMDANRR